MKANLGKYYDGIRQGNDGVRYDKEGSPLVLADGNKHAGYRLTGHSTLFTHDARARGVQHGKTKVPSENLDNCLQPGVMIHGRN